MKFLQNNNLDSVHDELSNDMKDNSGLINESKKIFKNCILVSKNKGYDHG